MNTIKMVMSCIFVCMLGGCTYLDIDTPSGFPAMPYQAKHYQGRQHVVVDGPSLTELQEPSRPYSARVTPY